eukprot:Hpha_TRINITY_DN16648_c3_g8::TRINITY_DN16648_c3_g8_i1::g.183430::m.183430
MGGGWDGMDLTAAGIPPKPPKASALQQGVAVRVAAADKIKEEWSKLKRDDYDPDMATVAGKQGKILHQHPSGAFSVVFEGKEAGLAAGEQVRFKFPPRALQPVDAGAPAAPAPAPKRAAAPMSPGRPMSPGQPMSPASPVTPFPETPVGSPMRPPTPPETPPQSPMAMRRLDSGLQPPSLDKLPSFARRQAQEDNRRLAMAEAEEEDERRVEEECQKFASPRHQDPAKEEVDEEDDEEDDEEEAYLAALAEEEAAEEAAFLADLDGSTDSPKTASPPASPP